mgnify:CR=1 FL=1
MTEPTGLSIREEERGEDRKERLEREHNELLQELRSLIPGAEVLFGFLLAISFTAEFGDLESEISTGVISFDYLVLRRPALIIGPRFEFGEAETSFFGVDGIDQDFYSVGFAVSVNFPGADSLVDLNRKYF